MTKLPTSPIHLNEFEVNLILPALEFVKEELDRSRWAVWAPRDRVYGGRYPGDVFREQRYDDELLVKLLEIWKKLRSVPAHRKVRCDVFDTAILALALRTTRHNDLSPLAKKPRTPARFSALERKLENLRRRLQRAATKKVGKAGYQDLRNRWEGFWNWLRYNILCFKRRRCSDSVNMLRRERREATRRFALEVVRPEVAEDAAARKQIIALADCARTEIQRGRHPGQWLSTLLKKPEAAKEFFANYIAQWGNPDWVQPKFWP